MPIFEFECSDCSQKFEKIVMNQKKICCPQCNSANLKKLFSTSSALSDDAKCNWDDPSLPSKQEFQQKRF